jgi:hypothetical protein
MRFIDSSAIFTEPEIRLRATARNSSRVNKSVLLYFFSKLKKGKKKPTFGD